MEVSVMAKVSDRATRRRSSTVDAAEEVPAVTAAAGVTVRHYCQGIGDCHLLRFSKKDGNPYWMLIDCGVHSSVSGGSETINQVVADIAEQTKHLDVIVVTHEHTDHTSGF